MRHMRCSFLGCEGYAELYFCQGANPGRLRVMCQKQVACGAPVESLAIIGVHPESSLATLNQYLVLPWPRRTFAEEIASFA